jgi:two-component system, sensor histidine kinase PdtaS
MSIERSPAHPFLGSHSAFRRLWDPGFHKAVREPGLADCTVDALRAALARESQLLQEKEILLQEQEVLRAECDHRLLNGLQMVVSLLTLQSRSATTPDVALQLSVAAGRVATVERVHRRLHFHDGTKTVGLKKYLEELCQDASGLSDFDKTPRLNILVEGCEIVIPTATAISLGFIANELITNAVKHGKGKIVLGLDADPDRGYALSVCNEGPALPAGFDPNLSKGLGMKIVRSLVKQIGGDFGFGRGMDNLGARFVVRFS